jgi:hypothetical protein
MSTTAPLSLNGQPVGRIKAGWLLFKETWRFMMLDKELLLVPIFSLIFHVLLFGVLVSLALLIMLGSATEIPEDSPIWLGLILAFSQAVISHIVYVRAHGGNASLLQGFTLAWSHAISLFVWSLITSTVGIILHVISERSQLLGKILAMVLGAAWGILTYFVVPAMVMSNMSAFAAIPQSGRVFKATWGETVVSNISYSLIFLLLFVVLMLSGVGLVVASLSLSMSSLAVVIVIVWVIAALFLTLVSSIFGGILKTLLYMYAVEGTVPANFNRELVEKMLARKVPVSSSPTMPMQTTI